MAEEKQHGTCKGDKRVMEISSALVSVSLL